MTPTFLYITAGFLRFSLWTIVAVILYKARFPIASTGAAISSFNAVVFACVQAGVHLSPAAQVTFAASTVLGVGLIAYGLARRLSIQ